MQNQTYLGADGNTYSAADSSLVSKGNTSTIGTNAAKPSSSASVILNNNATTAVNNATATINGTAPAPNAASAQKISDGLTGLGYRADSGSVQALLDAGYNPESITGLISAKNEREDARTTAAQEQANADSQYRSQLGGQNAQYASASATLEQHRSDALDTAKSQLAGLNSSGGIGSDASQFNNHINSQYDMAANQLAFQAEQAQAALQAGNLSAYNEIQDNMSKTIATTNANVQNLLATSSANKTQADQFAQTEKDKAGTLYANSLQNLPQPDAIASLPTDYSKLSPDQLKTLQGTSAYQMGINAGMTPQAVLADVQAAATKSKIAIAKQNADEKAANDATRAQIAMFNAQTNAANKQAAAADAQRVVNTANGSPFLDAFQAAQSAGGHTKQENNDTLSNLADQLEAGKTPLARQTIKNYALKALPTADREVVNGFADAATFAQDIKNQIAALPAAQKTGFVNGTVNDWLGKIGQTNDPQLAKLKASIDHFGIAYTTLLAGRRGNSQYTDRINSLLPSTKNSNELNLDKIEAIGSTADTFARSAIGGVIGDDLYSQIFTDGTNNTPQAPAMSNGIDLSKFNPK